MAGIIKLVGELIGVLGPMSISGIVLYVTNIHNKNEKVRWPRKVGKLTQCNFNHFQRSEGILTELTRD